MARHNDAMTTPETPEARKKRLAAARQARYVARKQAAGLVVGTTVPQAALDVLPDVMRVLKLGRRIGPALNAKELATFKLGRKVEGILEEGGPSAWALKKLLGV